MSVISLSLSSSLSLASSLMIRAEFVKYFFDGHDEYVDDMEESKQATMMMMTTIFSVSKAAHNILRFSPLVDACATRCDRI
jgi:hypothetical protein